MVQQYSDPTHKIMLGGKGLNEDLPPYILGTEYFNSALNMRVKDGSIQLVPKASLLLDSSSNPLLPFKYNVSIPVGNIFSFAKYIPFGTNYLDLIYVGATNTGAGYILFGTTTDSGATSVVNHIPLPAEADSLALSNKYSFTYDKTYHIDNFVFNGISIVNPKSNQPIYYNAGDASSSGYNFLPNWIYTTPVIIATVTVATVSIDHKQITLSSNTIFPRPGDKMGRGDFGTNPSVNSYTVYSTDLSTHAIRFNQATDFTVGDVVYISYSYNAKFMTYFQGRLFALNLTSQNPSGNIFDPIDFSWSNPMTSIQSLYNMTWTASATNSAGNLYLVDSPGELRCAIELGNDLIVYKSDIVYKIINSGAPYYYSAQPLYTDDGIISDRAVVEINQSKHFFVGNNGVWLHQGGIDKQNISRGRIEEALYRGPNGIDFRYTGQIFCYHNLLEKEVWICYRSKVAIPATSGAADIPGCDRAYCYNYITDTWYPRSLGSAISTTNAHYPSQITDVLANNVDFTLVVPSSVTYDNSTNAQGMWYFPHVTPASIGIFEDNAFVQFDSRDIGTASSVKNVNGIYPHADMPLNFKLKFSNNIKEQDYSSVLSRRFDPINLQYRNWRVDYRETGRYLHLQLIPAGLYSDSAITSLNPTANPRLTDIDIDFEKRGRR